MTMINVPLPLDLEPLAAAGTLPLEVAEEHAHATVSDLVRAEVQSQIDAERAGVSEGLCARCLVGAHRVCRQNAQAPSSGPFEAWRCVCLCRATNGRQNGAQR